MLRRVRGTRLRLQPPEREEATRDEPRRRRPGATCRCDRDRIVPPRRARYTALVEFIPDEDRLGPADAVRFAAVMLASTPAGNSWTFGEYRTMLQHAGFTAPMLHDLSATPMRAVIAQRAG